MARDSNRESSVAMISDQLLRILRCPITLGPLQSADEALVAQVNAAIGRGAMKTRLGRAISEPIEGGLVDQNRQFFMPILHDIPCLIADDAIDLRTLPP